MTAHHSPSVKLAHLADPHLGIRQYHRQTPTGINQREADVANAFRAAIDDVIACAPDAVLIAGDLFHSVRPTNAAIVFAFRQFQRLREAPARRARRPHRRQPRHAALRRDRHHPPAVRGHSACSWRRTEARRFSFPDLDLSVLAVPHQALAAAERPAMRPEGAERHQVLVLHGEVEGVFAHERDVMEYGGAHVTAEEIGADAWSYVALGHYHVQHQVAPRAWYAGSLDYVSPNIWGELRRGAAQGHRRQGLAAGRSRRRARWSRAPCRARGACSTFRSLDARRARPRRSSTLRSPSASRRCAGGIAEHVVRLVVRNCPRHVGRELDHAAIRAWKADGAPLPARPAPARPPTASVGVGAPGPAADAARDWCTTSSRAARFRPSSTASVRASRRGADRAGRARGGGLMMHPPAAPAQLPAARG